MPEFSSLALAQEGGYPLDVFPSSLLVSKMNQTKIAAESGVLNLLPVRPQHSKGGPVRPQRSEGGKHH